MLSDLLRCPLDCWKSDCLYPQKYLLSCVWCFVCSVGEGHANVGWIGEGYVYLGCVGIGFAVLVWVDAQL
jgi:hypothetical protein